MSEGRNEDGTFKEGNQAWKARSKHGRDAVFTEPLKMLETAEEYFKWCEENPFYKAEAKTVSSGNGNGSSVKIIEVPVKRPHTMRGLCLFIGVGYDYFINFKIRMKALNGEIAADFLKVIEIIETAIYENKFTGAVAGFFKENIIARDLGLKEKTDVTTGGDKITPAIDLTKFTIEDLKRLTKDPGDQTSDSEGGQG